MKYRSRFYFPIIISIVLVIGMFLGSILSPNHSLKSFSNKSDGSQKINEVLRLVQKDYVDTINESKLIENSLSEILKNLDPHSSYIPAKNFEIIEDEMAGNFDGIGVQFRIQNDSILVIMPINGGPSAKKGIRAGDRIVGVDGENITNINIDNSKVMKLLKGPKGSTVLLTIYRPSIKDHLEFKIIRDKIPMYSVDIAFMPTNNIGYIKINRFSSTTYNEFVTKTNRLMVEGMKKLIVDLRENGGGYLNQASNICDDFLETGNTIVYTEGRNRSKKIFKSTRSTRLKNIEVIVLINEYSASASEIVAGAIQDNDRGVIVGRRSFGKGLVQEQLEFNDRSAIRLTVARYYTPTGRCIQKSYKDGTNSYQSDIHNRYSNEELINPDSIHFVDSLKFYTPQGKVVYGGGGIMPDYFIPIDTSHLYHYYNQLSGRGLIYQFAFSYVDNNRNQLDSEYKTANQFIENFTVPEKMMLDLINYGIEKGAVFDKESYEFCKKDIEIRLKAFIGRSVFDNEAFYPVLLTNDKTYLKALGLFTE